MSEHTPPSVPPASAEVPMPEFPKTRVLASGVINGKKITLDGWHVEDFAEFRDRLSAYASARDAEVAALTEQVEKLTAERDAFKQWLYDELDGNLRLRELGGARPDEPMTPFLERVFAERDSLRSECERLRVDAECLARARAIAAAQAEDQGLWCIAESIVEAYVQQELQRLTAAVEGDAALREEQRHG